MSCGFLAGVGSALDLPVVRSAAHAAVDCAALVPSSDPTANRTTIQSCLDGADRAVLTPGTYRNAVDANDIESNTFIGYCAGPCVGTGYFAARDTGYDAARGWSASTTNYYRGNNRFGSNVGSRRGGRNWYVAATACPSGAPYPCNGDGHRHPISVDWAGNDGFYFYS